MVFTPTRTNLAALRAMLINNIPRHVIFQYLNCSRMTVSRWRRQLNNVDEHLFPDQRANNKGKKLYSEDEIINTGLMFQMDPYLPVTQIKEELF